jgi:hypothetical protein
MEKELLSVIATFKEFHIMLFGARIRVYTDHKDLTFHNLTSQRIMRWRNFLEEYFPTFTYIPGPLNVIVDAFSCMPRQSTAEEEEKQNIPGSKRPHPIHDSNFLSFHNDDDDLLECFLNHPLLEEMHYPLNYQLIQQNQFDDAQLQQL